MSKIIHVEYVGSGKYVGVFEVGPTTTFHDVISEKYLAFRCTQEEVTLAFDTNAPKFVMVE